MPQTPARSLPPATDVAQYEELDATSDSVSGSVDITSLRTGLHSGVELSRVAVHSRLCKRSTHRVVYDLEAVREVGSTSIRVKPLRQ